MLGRQYKSGKNQGFRAFCLVWISCYPYLVCPIIRKCRRYFVPVCRNGFVPVVNGCRLCLQAIGALPQMPGRTPQYIVPSEGTIESSQITFVSSQVTNVSSEGPTVSSEGFGVIGGKIHIFSCGGQLLRHGKEREGMYGWTGRVTVATDGCIRPARRIFRSGQRGM